MTATLTPRTARSTRAARVEAATRHRAEGLLMREIAALMGVSRSYVNSLLLDPEGTAERARKDRNGGVCEVCGAATDGSNGYKRAPTRCNAHNLGGEHRRGTGPTQRRFLIEIADGTTRFTDLAAAAGTSKEVACNVLHRLTAFGLTVRVSRGQYRLTAAGRRAIS